LPTTPTSRSGRSAEVGSDDFKRQRQAALGHGEPGAELSDGIGQLLSSAGYRSAKATRYLTSERLAIMRIRETRGDLEASSTRLDPERWRQREHGLIERWLEVRTTCRPTTPD